MKNLLIISFLILFSTSPVWPGEFEDTLKKADQGDAEAQFNLGSLYLDGEGVPQNSKKAVLWYTKSAEQGYSNSQMMLGTMYTSGESVPQDHIQAMYWYKKSAEQGNAYAQFQLGATYDYGIGVLQDYEQAIYWYKKSAEQGSCRAQLNLALMYDDGKGIPKDYKQAAFWYNKAAEQGDAKAQGNLGVLYSNGEGVTKDSKRALYWIEKSAEGGNALSQYKLGLFYEIGYYGVSKDYKQAAYWLKKAAEQGIAEAQYQLCRKYGLGQGVIESYKLAYVWANLAASQGHEGAIKLRDMARKMLSNQKLSEAQELAANIQYKIDHPDGRPNSIGPTSILSSAHEPMIYDDGWKTLTETELAERIQRPVLNINTGEPFNFKVVDKNDKEVGRLNTPAEYYQHIRAGNSLYTSTTYDIIDRGLFRGVSMPLLYLSKAKPSKQSYVNNFPFDNEDPLFVLPVDFVSWRGSDQREAVEKASAKNRPWRYISPNARVIKSTSSDLKIYDTFAEDLYNLPKDERYTGDQASHVLNPVVLGDLNNDGYEDVVLDCAHYNVEGSGRSYSFVVLTRTSSNDILKDITKEVDKLIWIQ